MLVAAWCRSVGTTWTLELRPVERGEPAGRPVDWITSCVPTSQPVPDTSAEELFGGRGLLLLRDAHIGDGHPAAGSRRVIGHVTRDAEAMRLARTLVDAAAANPVGPLPLAAQWIAAGFSADAATSWVLGGVMWPQVAATLISTELEGCAVSGVRPTREGAARF